MTGTILVLALVGPASSGSGEDRSAAPGSATAPVVKECRYRMSAAIRPLLFWIGDKDVGGAQIVWRRGPDGRIGYEFLLGSDPDRTPRRINRWGWVREDASPSGANQIGLMRRTDEETVGQAQAQVGFEGEYVFKVIRTRIAGRTARAENTVWLVQQDYTYYDLADVLRFIQGPPQSPPKVNAAELPPGTHPGFLFAVADLVDQAVAAARLDPRELPQGMTTRFNFNALAYELRLRKAKWEEAEEYGGRLYEQLVRLDFESYNPKLKSTERFTLVCGTDGDWRGVPVYVKYQPKWWFKAEGVIDESQVFTRRDAHSETHDPPPGGERPPDKRPAGATGPGVS